MQKLSENDKKTSLASMVDIKQKCTVKNRKGSILVQGRNSVYNPKFPSLSTLPLERSNNTRSTILINPEVDSLLYINDNELIDKAIEILRKNPKKRDENDKKLLLKSTKNLSFFERFNSEIQEQFAHYMYVREFKNTKFVFKEGESFFHSGSIGNTFFVILKGEVAVVKLDDEGKEIELKVLTKGEGFGEIALFEDKPRSASILCKGDCTFACLDKQYFNVVMRFFKILFRGNQRADDE